MHDSTAGIQVGGATALASAGVVEPGAIEHGSVGFGGVRTWLSAIEPAARAAPAGGVRSRCRFRNRGTDSLSEYGMKWMSGGTRRQCDRTLSAGPAAELAAAAQLEAGRRSANAAAAALLGRPGRHLATLEEYELELDRMARRLK